MRRYHYKSLLAVKPGYSIVFQKLDDFVIKHTPSSTLLSSRGMQSENNSWSRFTGRCYMLQCKSSRINNLWLCRQAKNTHSDPYENWFNHQPAFCFPCSFPYSLTLSPKFSGQIFYFSFMDSMPHTHPHPNCWMNSSFIAKMQPVGISSITHSTL